VRRSSDNTEQDIGFSSGNLDTSALTTFCSGTDGFVTTWYDQSGNNNNAIQSTAANQPLIVNGGTVYTKNSKPYLYASGSTFFGAITTNYVSIFTTFSASSAGLKSILGDIREPIYTYFTYNNYIGQLGKMVQGYKTTGTIPLSCNFSYEADTLKLLQIEDVGTGFYPNNYINNQLNTTGGVTTDIKNTKTDIFRNLAERNFNGLCSEIIFYDISQLSNKTAISTNINAYYGIY
jgi:hypothetical protein